jgi:NAD(P)-dependent dehydrogenase (short-subunit alcohol dehydrogenase family)
VLYVSDQLALHGRAYWGSYAPSKSACVNLIQTVADEWEANTNIHLNSIDPGPMKTALRRMAFPGEDPNQLPAPESVAHAFLYFMDTGQQWPSGKHFSWDSAARHLTEN